MKSRARLGAAKATLKTKKVKASKIAQYLADAKHMGDEPDFRGKTVEGLELVAAYNWYNYMCSKSDARQYLEEYLKSSGKKSELQALKRVPDVWVNLQAGWMARLMSRGAVVDQTAFKRRLQETLAKAGTKQDQESEADQPKVQPVRVSVQDRTAEKVSDTIGELEETIDRDGWTVDVYDWLTRKQVPPLYAKKAAEFFKPVAEEAEEVIRRDVAPQLAEGYKRFTKAQLKARAEFYRKLMVDCERFADVAKKQKAPRKKKTVTAEKRLKGLKYQKESKDFKVASVNPEKLLGAQELWTFNTKYKTLHCFRATDAGGLSVKGTSIADYSESSSFGYRLGRKAEDSIAVALKGGKRALSALVKGLKPCDLQHRCNENTILLRAE